MVLPMPSAALPEMFNVESDVSANVLMVLVMPTPAFEVAELALLTMLAVATPSALLSVNVRVPTLMGVVVAAAVFSATLTVDVLLGVNKTYDTAASCAS